MNLSHKERNSDIDYFRSLLSYDKETGELKWKVRKGRQSAGSIAGSITKTGYRHVGIDGYDYKCHRVAFFLHFGRWPVGYLDHKNRISTDNRIENLRECSPGENSRNMTRPSHNTSGVKGVGYCKQTGKYAAWIWKNHRKIWLGRHPTIEMARDAYMRASEKYHGEFGTNGEPVGS